MFFVITVSAGALGFDPLPPGARVEVERTATSSDGDGLILILSGSNRTETTTTVRDGARVDNLTRLGESGNRSIHRLTWTTTPSLVTQLHATDCTVLAVAWTGDVLTLELRFPDQTAASRFYAEYGGSDSRLTLRHTSGFGIAGQAEREALTPKQTSTLVHALKRGYFDVPRRVTLDDLAAKLGVSDSAVSQRLRRGMSNVLRSSVHVPLGPTPVTETRDRQADD